MGHLLYLMFRCDGDVMERLKFLWDLNTAHKRIPRLDKANTPSQELWIEAACRAKIPGHVSYGRMGRPKLKARSIIFFCFFLFLAPLKTGEQASEKQLSCFFNSLFF